MDNVTAIVVSFGYAHASLCQGFHRCRTSETSIRRSNIWNMAAALSQVNAEFLCEIGYAYQRTRVRDKALECFAKVALRIPENDGNGNAAAGDARGEARHS